MELPTSLGQTVPNQRLLGFDSGGPCPATMWGVPVGCKSVSESRMKRAACAKPNAKLTSHTEVLNDPDGPGGGRVGGARVVRSRDHGPDGTVTQ
eukprot:1805723-Rhodomonas_salina.1